MTRRNFLLLVLGSASLLAYLAALGLGDLRKNTIGFEVAFFGAFGLYFAAAALVVRHPGQPSISSRGTLSFVFCFALLFRIILLSTRPTLSDDMYRYVWDGRVQANGISPYHYPPDSAEIAHLKTGDRSVWRYINRKSAVTIYPPGAQIAYAGIWRIAGDSVTGFKAAFVAAELLGGLFLMRLLRHFRQPPERALIYLWSPLLVFEVAHAGHVDGLMLPLLIAAFWARTANRHTLLGLALGAATLVKLFPALLLPALLPLSWPLSRQTIRAPLKALSAFGGITLVGYLVYAFWGASPIGFLPQYFNENFNVGLAHSLFEIAKRLGAPGATLASAATFGGLAVMSLIFVVRPAASAREALFRCVWLIGWYTLFTQNLFSWYLLWLLPLIAVFLEPGKFLGFKLVPMTAWLVFSGTIALSYVFFIRWRPAPETQIAEYAPLYALLLLSFVVRSRPAPVGLPGLIRQFATIAARGRRFSQLARGGIILKRGAALRTGARRRWGQVQ